MTTNFFYFFIIEQKQDSKTESKTVKPRRHKIERKMSHLNIAFDRYASIGHCNALHFGNKPTVPVWNNVVITAPVWNNVVITSTVE